MLPKMLESFAGQLSLWEIAHRWYDEDPNHDGDPTLKVQDLLRFLTFEATKHMLQLCDGNGELISTRMQVPGYELWQRENDPSCELTNKEGSRRYHEYFVSFTAVHDEITKNFSKCYQNRQYDKEELDNVFVERNSLALHCFSRSEPLPAFWFVPGEEIRFPARLYGGDPGAEIVEIANRPGYKIKGLLVKEELDKAPDLDLDQVGSGSFAQGEKEWSYPTPKMKLLNHVAKAAWDRWWSLYDPDDRTTAPDGDLIVQWILENFSNRKITKTDANVIQRALRNPESGKGGRKMIVNKPRPPLSTDR